MIKLASKRYGHSKEIWWNIMMEEDWVEYRYLRFTEDGCFTLSQVAEDDIVTKKELYDKLTVGVDEINHLTPHRLV